MSTCLILILSIFSHKIVAQTTLRVAAAADLAPLEPGLTAAFHQQEPGIELQFVNEASAALAQQIENGAPYDVFLSANTDYVKALVQKRKIEASSVRAYAEGRVGLLWKDGKARPVKELNEPWVHFVGLPNPQLAPYGVAARQALEHAGLWQSVQPKVVYGENVRQALQLVESGNADAVLTAASLLRGKPAELIPLEWHQPILQTGGVVSGTKNLVPADHFLNFLTSAAGQAVFARFGFSSPRL